MTELAFKFSSRSCLFIVTKLTLLVLLSTGCGHCDDNAPSGQKAEQRRYFFQQAGMEVDYSLFVPSSYDKTVPHPLLVLLHDYGSTPSKIMEYAGITEEATRRGFIAVAPFGYNERGWYGCRGTGKKGKRFGWDKDPDNLGELSERDVVNVIELVEKEFTVDPKRRYLLGHGMGASGALHLAVTNPQQWSAIAAVSPAFADAAALKTISQIPTMCIAVEKEEHVSPADVTQLFAQLKHPDTIHRLVEIKGRDANESVAEHPEIIADVFDFLEGKFAGEDKDRSEVYRLFTSAEGRAMDAHLVSAAEDSVVVRRMNDRKEFTLPVSSLSKSDQSYINGWLQRKRTRDSIAALEKAMSAAPDPDLEEKLIERLHIEHTNPAAAHKQVANEISQREALTDTLDKQIIDAFAQGDDSTARMLQVKAIDVQEELQALRVLRTRFSDAIKE
ncbi:MAG: alpha/beta hydrolase [Verrucomicrobiae bacterium]|nr:alpha/beta hydrolase [Verrucomicrobiae bacterium]